MEFKCKECGTEYEIKETLKHSIAQNLVDKIHILVAERKKHNLNTTTIYLGGKEYSLLCNCFIYIVENDLVKFEGKEIIRVYKDSHLVCA